MVHRSHPTTRHKHVQEVFEKLVLWATVAHPSTQSFHCVHEDSVQRSDGVTHNLLSLSDTRLLWGYSCSLISLLCHPAQAHLLLPKAYVDGSSTTFLSGLLLWDIFAANYMASFSKRQRSNNQPGSGWVTSYYVIPVKSVIMGIM